MREEYAIDFIDDKGIRFVWEKVSYEEHANKREELKDPSLKDRIKKAIYKETYEIIESYLNKGCNCYYYKEYEFGDRTRYTKVIVDMSKEIKYIRTAYRPDKIAERKYHKPLWTRQ